MWANLAGWHYIVSVVAIGVGETLAFANYFKILLEQLGVDLTGVDSRIIAILLVAFFLVLNYRGIELSGKAQTVFVFFFWGCSMAWFLYMIPNIHMEYFGDIAMDSLPPSSTGIEDFCFSCFCCKCLVPVVPYRTCATGILWSVGGCRCSICSGKKR